ncbi:fatty acyl-AMP ligase [Streptomyces sp. SCSIO ZS0520]|uniref:fatty acyl-AMP ligase n=1 Tax=Streptomyces sp. SCSIO ZS0520 TaxID=2892996 RepID=UPI0021D9D72A|nr:fatty acyl-AMP ligase [Streptomyces sp. SCSIO ZS0520]
MTSDSPPTGPLLTDHLRHWAAARAHQRAFTHVDFPGPTAPGTHRSLSWRALDERARAVADGLLRVAAPGERAALVLPQGLDYVSAFLGCLYAGVIAVPLFTPELPGHEGRLASVLRDCEPACLLVTSAGGPTVAAFAAEHGLPEVAQLPVDELLTPGTGRLPSPAPEDIAYLQYTSGSTRTPAGVLISHANVLANARQGIAALNPAALPVTTVGWLPLFHDMGLLLSVAAPVTGGFPSVLMDPVAFLEEPARWLRLLGGYPGAISAAPNFAYDYCVARTDEDTVDELRLERVRALLNGSEPVRGTTLERFAAHFAPAGLAPEALCPAYGLAEATVFVTSDSPDRAPDTVRCSAAALAEGRVEPGAPGEGRTALLVCGPPAGQEIRVADPATGAVLGPGAVGEIQLRGPNIGLGYWKKDQLSADCFGVHAPGEGAAEGGWLRTGDLGALYEGRLLVTGRLKDLIIVDGRNHYPQDIEETVQSALAVVRRDRLTAVGVPAADGTGEELVVIAEHRRGLAPGPAEAREALALARAAVSARHGVRLADLVLVAPGAVPRTSSGKVARAASRARLTSGGFAAVEAGR